MIVVTGDKHGQLGPIKEFSKRLDTSRSDILIILGDAGFNYQVARESEDSLLYVDDGAVAFHRALAKIPLTIAVVQGNHECPAWECQGMTEVPFHGGTAFIRREAPNVFYLQNGQVYTFDGKDYLVMGGAHSIDKNWLPRRIPVKGRTNRANWFPHEQMTDEEFRKAEEVMEARGNRVHGILSHTCPMSKRPMEVLLKGVKSGDCDDRMEEKFEELAKRFEYEIWYFGHFHADRAIDDRHRVLFDTFEELK